jgi:early secretory antigenic target protein ESAT-6
MTYQANWSDQQEGASFVSSAVSRLDQQLSDINRGVNQLIANWDSDAQKAYHARQTKWNASADNIKHALTQFVSGLNNSADISSGTEHTNVGVVSG